MPKMTFSGSLPSILDDLAFDMSNLYVTSGGTRVEFDSFWESGLTLFSESRISVPSSGPHFLTGTIDRLRFDDITLDGLVVKRLLLIENMNVQAERVFDLIQHIPGANIGDADANAFRAYLNNRDWNLVGSSGIDRVEGSVRMSLEGNDTIRGLGGSDYLDGGRGKDAIFGGAGMDTLLGRRGDDTLKGGAGKDALAGGYGGDRLFGNGNNDRLEGNAGADRLFGGNGIDILRGGSGKDMINGGKGADAFYGGGGADTFVFGASHGRDRIRDFQNDIDMLKFDRPGKVTVTATSDGALLTSTEGSVLLEGINAKALSLDDGLWS